MLGIEATDVVGFSLRVPWTRKYIGEFNLGWRDLDKEKRLFHSAYFLINDQPDLFRHKSEKMEMYYGGGYKLLIEENVVNNDENTEEKEKELEPTVYLRANAGLRYQNKIFELFFSLLPGFQIIPELELDLSVSLGIRFFLP